ncbi:MAG: hypothetical protein LBQ36_01850, partial [Synergistaceae bacterium]|nr:hypothetical protein [Synergistaceae bacterium]
EARITAKRIATLVCSMAVIVFYGYALGGAGGYLFGRGRPKVIALGLAGGACLTYIALALWKSYLSDVSESDGRGPEGGPPPP